MSNLPPEYVPVLRKKLRRVVKHLHAQYSAEIEAAYERGLADAEQQIVYGLKTVAKLNGSGAPLIVNNLLCFVPRRLNLIQISNGRNNGQRLKSDCPFRPPFSLKSLQVK